MNTAVKEKLDPKLDLILERTVDVAPELVWEAWTNPEHLMHWFCPKPWSVSQCKIDLRPGGLFHTTMRSPEGQEHPGDGCYLEIVKNKRLVWTSALLPEFRPSTDAGLLFTGKILLEAAGTGTRYTAIAMHATEASQQEHDKMGFHDGWSTCLDQLVVYMKGIKN